MIGPVVFGSLIAAAIVIRLVAGSFDGDRVAAYIRGLGGELIERRWDPFGPGWFGEKDARIYAIVYRDRDGAVHHAHAKTSMLSGVYLTNDRVTHAPVAASVEAEKARLRARLAELERRSG